ncbi:hypothetical protein QFC22_003529 [Naganishia vaughanmartiniae]|uniref:Uncharacterized protein n=1 Tax=Naganishia vaughanmartiniae TaxID=1424756 RepID=A0ACC2X5I7_9TREE|nr:hypothetical protein QFC22_003529 [Naganishia vaughanmartiniae]
MSSTQQGPFVLVSGANRGIGLNLVSAFLEKTPSAIIFAGARDPTKATELNELAKKHPNNIHVIKLVADDAESNKAAVEDVKKVTDRLDVVIANAGIGSGPSEVHTDDISLYKSTFEVNTLGPLHLYQATYPLLIASRTSGTASKDLPAPKFFITSSGLGSLGAFFSTFILTPYGTSKAAVNYVALAIHHQTEDAGAVVIPYHPGLVMTDMGPKEADSFSHIPNMPRAITAEQSAKDYVDLVDRSTRAEHGGKFWGQGSSEPYPW